MVLGAPDRVNIPCLMHDTRLCHLDVKWQITIRNKKYLNSKPVKM